MVTYLLKKSYQLKDLREIEFQDLWGGYGVFTTMWIYGSPPKILFFKEHILNLLKSIKHYKIYKSSIKKDINKLIKNNNKYKVGRYHSLKLKEPFYSKNFDITMRCAISGSAMALENNTDKIYGFQFHPESFLTKNGDLLIKKILSA